jgi:hypothetical protein
MVYFTKNDEKKRQKITILLYNTLHAETVQAAGLKFAVTIPITIRELLNKTFD